VGLLFLLPFLFLSFISFDRLVRYQHTNHYDAWCRDGKPLGMFWKPQGINLIRSGLAFHKVWPSWLFVTPSWATGDPAAMGLLRRYRSMVAIWNVGFLLLVGLVAVSSRVAG